MKSINNHLILEPYKGTRKLQAKGESGGFVTVAQKTNLVALTLLVDTYFEVGPKMFISMDTVAQASEGIFLKKGCKVYFKEEDLCNMPQFNQSFESDAIEGPFIIADYKTAIMVTE